MEVVAARFAVPFYLRLPTGLFKAWEPKTGVCAILNFRRIGELSFSGTSTLVSESAVLDAWEAPKNEIPEHGMLMTCKLADDSEISTLRITTGKASGFTELRAYSELEVFLTVDVLQDLAEVSRRVQDATNHLVDVYRTVTQDPWVHRLDFELDTFVIDFAKGAVPEDLTGLPPAEILRNLTESDFPAR